MSHIGIFDVGTGGTVPVGGTTGKVLVAVTGLPPKWLAAGVAGQVLTTQGAGFDPQWTNAGVSGQTEFAVIVGNNAGSISSLPLGTTGTVFIGNTGANPSFTANPSVTGTITAATVRTGDPAVLAGTISATASTISTDGTAANVDFTVAPKGTGAIRLNAHTGGSLIFRGITTGGWTDIDWHMEQHVVQTLNATPTAIFSLVLPAKRVVTIKAMVNGFQDDYSDTVGGEILVTAYRDNAGGNIKLVGAPIINVNYTDLIDTSDINAGIDVGTQSINIYAIGVAAQTWNWATTVQYMYTIDNA